jgi:hypothetical protein
MKNIKSLAIALAVGGAFFSCSYTAPEPPEDPTNPRTPPVAGTADFSKYVAVGNSITAGMMDNALYLEGQRNAYPVILAERMKMVNPDLAFNVPEFGTANGAGFGGVLPNGTPIGRFQFVLPDCPTNMSATRTLGMTPAPTIPGETLAPFAGNRATLNNFSAAGTKSYHALVNGYGASPVFANPFYWRFASAPTASLVGDAVAAKGTFFSYWLGNMDALFYAISGGSGNPNPGNNPATYGNNDMTSPAVFAGSFNAALDALLSTGANTKGIVATIPDVTRLPFFQIVNDNLRGAAVPFTLSAAQAAALNAGYGQLGPAAAQVNFQAGPNFPVIVTSTGLRHMNLNEDFLTLLVPQDSLFLGPISACNTAQRAGWGISSPIPGQFVLDRAEVTLVKERINAYNTVIRAAEAAGARNDRVAVADMHAVFNNLPAARNTFIPGGYISVDGVHPNPRGQAMIANEFIKAINARFSSTLAPVDLMNYRQNILPAAP